MHRFFIHPGQISGETVVMTGDDVNHITRSLRLQIGETITVSTGEGMDYLVRLQDFQPGTVVARILDAGPSRGEPSVEVTLFQGLPKSDKLDLIVQKCTELGIRRIIPVETSRTIVKLNDKKADRRTERWQKIAEEAAKQSARGRIPEVGHVLTWKEYLNFLRTESFDLFLVPWEEAAGLSIRGAVEEARKGKKELRRVAYLIGPEGGLCAEEVKALTMYEARPVTLGPRILRTETAGFTVLTVLMYEFMQMEGCGRG